MRPYFPSISRFSGEMRRLGFHFSFSYGTGGYCVELFDARKNKTHVGFSWDIDSLIAELVERALLERYDDRDEDTNPGKIAVENESKRESS